MQKAHCLKHMWEKSFTTNNADIVSVLFFFFSMKRNGFVDHSNGGGGMGIDRQMYGMYMGCWNDRTSKVQQGEARCPRH